MGVKQFHVTPGIGQTAVGPLKTHPYLHTSSARPGKGEQCLWQIGHGLLHHACFVLARQIIDFELHHSVVTGLLNNALDFSISGGRNYLWNLLHAKRLFTFSGVFQFVSHVIYQVLGFLFTEKLNKFVQHQYTTSLSFAVVFYMCYLQTVYF
ncbi:hypothetical protein SDC9_111719 [bioreactor metagenome]|uniref:Uncharacterized protein n=1 Tax=bioreactor metagenome TaxID=1076179 RepID=A0A645BIB9_9ZZZZ